VEINHRVLIDIFETAFISPIKGNAGSRDARLQMPRAGVKYSRGDGEGVYLGYVCIPAYVRHDLLHFSAFPSVFLFSPLSVFLPISLSPREIFAYPFAFSLHDAIVRKSSGPATEERIFSREREFVSSETTEFYKGKMLLYVASPKTPRARRTPEIAGGNENCTT